MVKASYEVMEKKEVEATVVVQMPTKIMATVRAYRNGSYLWLPREWGGKKVIIQLVQDEAVQEEKQPTTSDVR